MKLPLPDLKTFKSRKKEPSPLIAFYDYVMAQVMPNVQTLYSSKEESAMAAVARVYGKGLDVSKISISEQDEKALRELQKEWYIKKQKFTKERAQKALGWEWLDIGPKTTDQESGFVYVEDNYLVPVRRNNG